MRYLIISDIHANLEALEAVVALAPPTTFDRLLVLGDIVGYGADPNAVVDRVRAFAPHVIIRGNHDKVASGLEDAEGFNAAARQSALWTHDQLTEANRAYLAALPAGPRTSNDTIEVCHGAPYDEDAYLFEHGHALQALEAAARPLCFFGHTHVQIGYWVSSDAFDVIVPDGDHDCVVTAAMSSSSRRAATGSRNSSRYFTARRPARRPAARRPGTAPASRARSPRRAW